MDSYNRDERGWGNTDAELYEKIGRAWRSKDYTGIGKLLCAVAGNALREGRLLRALKFFCASLVLFVFGLHNIITITLKAFIVVCALYILWMVITIEPSDFNKAKTAYKSGDYKTAVEYYMKAAENDSVNRAVALNILGNCYYSGKGVEQSYVEAVKYYRLSAELGYHWGEYNLATCYYDGEGVTKDFVEAVRLFKLAAEEDNASALSYLGLCHHFGEGVEKNLVEAVNYYRRAAELGDLKGEFYLGWCYFYGVGVEQNYEEAAKLFKSVYEKNYDDAYALRMLADCYYHGYGVETDYKEAFRLYCLSEEKGAFVVLEKNDCYRVLINVYLVEAENGSVEAQNMLGDCYYNGLCNYKEALKWYRIAAKNGSAEAYNNVGQCYFHGHGTKQDYAKAVVLFKEAVVKGSSSGEYNLGYCYYNGFGVKKDIAKAKEFFKSAADKGNSQAKEMLEVIKNGK